MDKELATAVERVIDHFGTLAATGSALGGIRAQAIMKWRTKGRVPLERVPEIEAATGISRHELRPDFFGRLAEHRKGDAA